MNLGQKLLTFEMDSLQQILHFPKKRIKKVEQIKI